MICVTCHSDNAPARTTCLACGMPLVVPLPPDRQSVAHKPATQVVGGARTPWAVPMDANARSPWAPQGAPGAPSSPAQQPPRQPPFPPQPPPGPSRPNVPPPTELGRGVPIPSGAPTISGILLEKRTGEPPQLHLLQMGRNILGRDPDNCNVLLQDGAVSRQHAMVFLDPGAARYTDISQNGSSVNGKDIKGGESVPLANEAVLQLGDATLVLLLLSPKTLDVLR